MCFLKPPGIISRNNKFSMNITFLLNGMPIIFINNFHPSVSKNKVMITKKTHLSHTSLICNQAKCQPCFVLTPTSDNCVNKRRIFHWNNIQMKQMKRHNKRIQTGSRTTKKKRRAALGEKSRTKSDYFKMSPGLLWLWLFLQKSLSWQFKCVCVYTSGFWTEPL